MAGVGRLVRHGILVIAAGLLLTTGCSRSSSTTGSAGTGSASSTASPDTSTTVTSASTTTAAAATTTRPATASTTGATAPATTTAQSGPLVASAGGWRMAVSAPAGGARVGSSMTVCYEIAGTSREPVLVLEVTALPAGSATGAAPIRADVAVGRGSVRVPLTSVPPGVYHLRIQLILNGERLEGVAVTVPSVTLAPDAPAGTCP